MADRYWVGGTGVWNTTSTTNWSSTSGGSGGASVPTATDSVFFNQATTYTVTLTGALNCLDLTVSAGNVTFATGGSPTLAVSGSFSIVAATIWNSTGTISFIATSLKTITTNGCVIGSSLTFNGIGGTWQLQDALTIQSTRTTTLSNGNLDLNNFTLTTGSFSSASGTTRSIAFGTGNITLIGTGIVWNTSGTSAEIGFSRTGTPTVNVSNNSAIATTVAAGTGTTETQALDFNFTTGTYSLTASGNYQNFNLTGFNGTLENTARTIYGDFNNGTTATLTAGTNITTFAATSGVHTITTNGVNFDFPITFNGIGGTWQLQDALTIQSTHTTTLSNGNLDLNNFILTTGSFILNASSNPRSIAFGTGNITLIGTGTVWTASGGSVHVGFSRTGTPTVNVSNNSATAANVAAGTPTFLQALDFNFTTGTYLLTAGGNYQNFNLTGFNGTLENTARTIYGDFNSGTTATLAAGTNITTFGSLSGIKTITTNGRTINFPFSFNDSGSGNGNWQLQDALTFTNTINVTLTSGTLDLNNFTLTTGFFISNFSIPRSIAFGTGNITLIGTIGTVWNFGVSAGFSRTGTPTVNVYVNGGSITVAAGTGTTETQALDFNFTAGTDSVTFTGNCRNLNLTGFTGAVNSAARTIYGSLNVGTGSLNGGTGITTFAATSGVHTITTNGLNFDFPITFNGIGGTWQLQGNLIMGTTRTLTLTNGTFDAVNYNVTCASVQSSGTGVRTLAMGSGTWTVSGTTGTLWDFSTSTNATVTGTATISLTSGSAKTFAGGGIQTYPTINQGGAGALTISGSNKFANITNTSIGPVRFTGGTTNEFSQFNLNGTSTSVRLTLGSTNTTQAILKKPTAWNVGTGSLNSGNNTGLSFTAGGNNFLAISYINGQISTSVIPSTNLFFLLF